MCFREKNNGGSNWAYKRAYVTRYQFFQLSLTHGNQHSPQGKTGILLKLAMFFVLKT